MNLISKISNNFLSKLLERRENNFLSSEKYYLNDFFKNGNSLNNNLNSINNNKNAINAFVEKLKNEKYFRIDTGKILLSIGNLSFGGTGKTPFIESLVNDFIPPQFSKCILERGYKRAKNNEFDLILTNENFKNYSVDEIGDEPLMLFEKLHLPISISNKKYIAAINAIKSLSPDILILDDGFQHQWLERDLNIVIIDNNSLRNPSLPPFGRLREPFRSLKRADIIFVNDKSKLQELYKLSDEQLLLSYEFREGEPYPAFAHDNTHNYSFSLSSENIFAFCGIANPSRFFNSLKKINIFPKETKTFPDHFNYNFKNINNLISIAKKSNSKLITTEKDFIKIREFKDIFIRENIDLFILPIKFHIFDDNNFFKNRILSTIKNKHYE